MDDPAVRLGEFTTGAVQDVTGMSHPCTDGVIGARHHQGAPCEGQRLQDHTCVLACVVHEELQMHNTSAPPSIAM